jgi:hypothetical protein
MFNGYSELRALAPDTYLNWQLFGTLYDRDDDYARDPYAKGCKIAVVRETNHGNGIKVTIIQEPTDNAQKPE